MKTTVLFLFGAFGLCSAQTIITKAFNDPAAGDVVNYYNVNGTVNNTVSTGTPTFANGSLTQGTASPTSYSTPSASEISTFPGSTLKMVAAGNTVFYKSSAAKLEITGLITADATLNLSANNGTFISYPAALGYTETDQAQGTFTSSAANGLCRGTITITADASGTLLLGTTTFTNVLRIKSVQAFNLYLPNDTSFTFPIGTVTNTAYSYYNSTYKSPVLSSTQATIVVAFAGINQTTNGAQMIAQNSLAVASTAKKEDFTIYPNPAQDFIGFKGNTENYTTASIYTLDGKLIKTSDMKSGKVQISELPTANYFIQVSGTDAKTETVKLIKK
ncbi:hypothetical protein B0A69_15585 [Chryseobacterium shigense]|uniref:Por secretion system C-terminal sorting domain-containing protein n=1 Tax=Chryseobacterium shigense TaxID=297244 RepID=A0A1N7ITC7_9FLAO|nr:T9SS type A sorting domain-containing protein [Chryseobacterium shigense]PQA92452.1 hypothetical protein B0A69_15585 [Chryseobacterium shigense]SIS40266.1 Por secretion system C-terminal sorting domain-containing protein [Chryseobacterium shigense]